MFFWLALRTLTFGGNDNKETKSYVGGFVHVEIYACSDGIGV